MININGKITPGEEALLPASNRAVSFGDAVFETMRVSTGDILFWEDHYFRLMASMRIMRMDIPMDYTMTFLEEQVLNTVKSLRPETHSARVKLLVYRNGGGRYTPENHTVSFVIHAQPLEPEHYLFDSEPYEIEIYKDHYVPSGLLSSIKTTNRAVNILGSIYAEENGYDNCLLLNEKKMVVGALNANIFLVNGKNITTPPVSDGCLRGILRKQLIGIIGKLPELHIAEKTISPFELQKADELFLTNAISGIRPVTNFRKKTYNSNTARELNTKLNAAIRLH